MDQNINRVIAGKKSKRMRAIARAEYWEKVDRAVSETEKGTPIRKAARMFGVPESTVRTRKKTHVLGQPITPKHYRRTTFSEDQENLLLRHCRQMTSLGYSYAAWQVIDLAQNTAMLFQGLKRKKPTKEWFYKCFLKRHPEFSMEIQKKGDSTRTEPNNEIFRNYFIELNKTLEAIGIKDNPDHIWNLDETGVSLDYNPPKVLTCLKEKGHMMTAGKSPNTTLISAVSAIGETLPPYLIFKGNRVSDEMRSNTLEETVFKGSETGWSDSLIFQDFMMNHLARHITRRPILLLYDGYTTHYPSAVIEAAKEQDIHFFVLPPHSSRLLQPLDGCVFGPFKRQLDTNIHNWMLDHPMQIIQKEELPGLICTSLKSSMTDETIISSFRKTGIFPFNSDITIDDMSTAARASMVRNHRPLQKAKKRAKAKRQ